MGHTVSMTTIHTKWDGEITNRCTCTDYNEATDTWEDSNTCYNTCWDDNFQMFREYVLEWWNNRPSDVWEIEGLPLWNRQISGSFRARLVGELLQAITVGSEWILRYRLEGKTLHLNISHHDVPMGGSYTVTYGEAE